MDSTKVFCPNATCPANGQIGKGNLTVHDRKKRRYRCKVCKKPFSQRQGPPFYRLRTSVAPVVRVLKLLAQGCRLQALVFAFAIAEHTVMNWLERSGRHCQAVDEHLVEQPRLLGAVRMDEIRVKMRGQVVSWMALARAVPPRWWLGGALAVARDAQLIQQLVARVKRASSALGRGRLVVSDGLKSYASQIKAVFGEPVCTGQRGRPPLIEWPKLHIVQVIKRYVAGKLVGLERRIVQGEAAWLATLRHKVGGGVLNTACSERLNSTFRSHVAVLGRRTRALAGGCERLQWGMYVTGVAYNFCCEPASLRLPGLIGGHKGLGRTPAMAAGLSDDCWRLEELLTYHVVPPPWRPPKQRRRPSRALKALIQKWTSYAHFIGVSPSDD